METPEKNIPKNSLKHAINSRVFLEVEKANQRESNEYAKRQIGKSIRRYRERKRRQQEEANKWREIFFAKDDEAKLAELKEKHASEPELVDNTVEKIKKVEQEVTENSHELNPVKKARMSFGIGRRLIKLPPEHREKLFGTIGYSNYVEIAKNFGIAVALNTAETPLTGAEVAIATSIAASLPALDVKAAIAASAINLGFMAANIYQNWRLMENIGTTDNWMFTGAYIIAKKLFPNSKRGQAICSAGIELGWDVGQSATLLLGIPLSHLNNISTFIVTMNGLDMILNSTKIAIKEGLLRNVFNKEQLLSKLPFKKHPNPSNNEDQK